MEQERPPGDGADGREPPEDATRIAPRDELTRGEPTGGEAAAGAPAGRGNTLAAGELLGHTYRIEALLARGGMGEVYRARHVELGHEHAIKIILPELANDPKIVELFRREASALRGVRNDAVVAYDGLFRDERGRLYLVMEFVDGPSLAQVMRERPLGPEEVRQLRDRLALGLAAAHENGVIHRDISPDNVILPGHRIETAKIIDFGISKLADPSAGTVVGEDFAGKYSFVSPEQLGMFGGKVDPRSDVYSLGLVLAAAAIGEPLDMGMTPISVIEARRSVPDLSRVPPELRDEIAAMLEPLPEDRPPSMRALVSASPRPRETVPSGDRDGRTGAGGRTDGGLAAGPRERPVASVPAKRRKGPIAAVLVLLILILAGGASYLFLMQPDRLAGTTPAETVAAPDAGPAPAAEAPPDPDPPAASPGPETAAPEVADAPPEPIAPIDNDNVRDMITQLLPKEEPPDPAAVRRELDAALGGFECASLSASLSDDREAVLTGHVSSNADIARLGERIAAVKGVGSVINAVTVYDWPYCEAVAVLRGHTEVDGGVGRAPVLRPNNASRVYQEGETLIVRANGTGLYDGYLYVDYIDNDGTVVHLFPTPLRPDNRVRAGQEVVLGTERDRAGPDDRFYLVGPPFGTNGLLVIATPQPLFDRPRDEVERAEDYLPALRRSLERLAEQGRRDSLMSSYLFITTRPRNAASQGG